MVHVVCKLVWVWSSVQTDFPPAEGPANYSANYPARPPATKKCRYPALARHPVRARGLANCQIFGHFWANVRQFWQNTLPILAKYVCILDKSPAILPKLRYLPELRSDIWHLWTPTKGPDPAKCSAFCLAGGPAPARGLNLTFLWTLVKHEEKDNCTWCHQVLP